MLCPKRLMYNVHRDLKSLSLLGEWEKEEVNKEEVGGVGLEQVDHVDTVKDFECIVFDQLT